MRGCRIYSLAVYIRFAIVELGIKDPREISKATSDRETREVWVHVICRGDSAGRLLFQCRWPIHEQPVPCKPLPRLLQGCTQR